MYTILSTDGTQEVHHAWPTIDAVHALLGCTACHVVRLGGDTTLADDVLILVHDAWVRTDKPLNPAATALYRRCTGRPHPIHGDVVLTRDRYW